jgi:KDO2-lipid IV(A) lauroyltransferase
MRPLPLWLGYRVAGAVAGLCYHFFRPQARGLNANIAHVTGSRDGRRNDALARRSFRNFGKFVIDFIRFPVLTKDEVRRRLVFHQWAELDEVMASKRGAIFVTMHYGVFDLGAAALATYGYPTNAIGENYGYHRMNDIIHNSRRALGIKVIPADKVTVGVFRALKRGEILAMLIDLAPPGTEITVDFMGGSVEVSSIPARIALRTGAWIVPGLILRGPEKDELIRPILDTQSLRNLIPGGDVERDVKFATERIMASYESLLKQHPEQWLAFRPLWKEKPELAPV